MNLTRVRSRERRERLELIERRIAEGKLRIRQATPAEREQWRREREAKQ